MTGWWSRGALAVAVAGVVQAVIAPRAAGAAIAGDSAVNAAYAAEAGGAWKGLNPTSGENPPGADDGGFGFQPWNFAGGFHYPQMSPYGQLNHFIDGVDFPHSSFNALGAPAFALTNANLAFGGSTARATRSLDAPLGVGGVVELDFDNPLLLPFNEFAASGFGIRLNAGNGPVSSAGVSERFGMFTTSNFNNGNWSTTDSAGFFDLALAPSQTTSGARFRFTLTSAETYQMQVVSLAGGATLASRTGSLKNAGSGPIDSIEVLLFENGSGNGVSGPGGRTTGEREFYFNNLKVMAGGLTGDYDGDRDVDGQDFLVWQRTLGSTSDLGADGNSNGVIDAGDLQAWRSNFGAAGGGAAAITAPEPGALALAAVAGAVVAAIQSRRRGRRCQSPSASSATMTSSNISW
jgi:hypothetical protein